MDYEIKNISISSVLKVSSLVILTVAIIFVILMYLFILCIISRFGNAIDEIPIFNQIDISQINLFIIIAASVINGLVITVFLVLVLLLVIIFYNLYAHFLGGIRVTLSENKNNVQDVANTFDE